MAVFIDKFQTRLYTKTIKPRNSGIIHERSFNMKRKIISTVLIIVMIFSILPAALIPTFAAGKTEIPVVWHSGYVGGDTNSSNKNKLSGANASYKYSDIIVVEKAGTKISFSDTSCAGDSNSKYVSNTAYLFSTWKKSGSDYILDLDGANVTGCYQYEALCQKRIGASDDDGMLYEFVTDHDAQAIRLCYRCTDADTDTPKVYMESTTEKSTLQTLKDRDLTASLTSDGKVTGLVWNIGYLGSLVNTNGSSTNIRYSSSTYAISNLFVVPKAGTKISFTHSCTPNANYDVFARYELNAGGRYEYKTGYNATDTLVRSGSNPYTYSYVTSKDNEVLRIGCKPGISPTTKILLDKDPVTVTWEATNEKGTEASVNTQKTEWPDPELISIVTGAPLIGNEVKDLTWVNGYIGSQYQDNASKQFVYTSPSNKDYYTSSVFTVPKAGTKVVFFDQTFTDFDGGTLSSTSVLTLSHWDAAGKKLDKTKAYFTGCSIYQIGLTEKYRVYEYITTEDNENLRLCLRYAPVYASEKALIPPVYLVEKTDFTVKTEPTAPALVADTYTNASGAKVEFSYYLPLSYNPDNQYSLVFDASDDNAVAKALAENCVKNSIVIAFHGNSDTALRLLDEVVRNYPVKVSDILLVGGDPIAVHAQTYECIRLAQALIYTGSGSTPKLEYASVKNIADFTDAKAAADWLIGEYDDYYPVLEGIKMYALGDSYFGGSSLGQHQTWVNLIGYQYDMSFINFGIGGNTVARASGTGSNQPPMCNRYTEMPMDGNLYFIEGGRNDRHYSVPYGTNDSTNGSTFKGALNIIISAVRQKAPDALIVLVTPWSNLGEKGYLGTNNTYAQAMIELAEYYNDKHVICMNNSDTKFTGIDMAVSSCRLKYCLTPSDVSHLNANGMYMVKDKFEKWLAEQYAAFIGTEAVNFKNEALYDEVPVQTTPSDDSTSSFSSPDESTAPLTESKGCGSTVAITALILPAAAVVLVRRKKED